MESWAAVTAFTAIIYDMRWGQKGGQGTSAWTGYDDQGQHVGAKRVSTEFTGKANAKGDKVARKKGGFSEL